MVSTALRYYFAPWAEDRALWGTDVRADALLAGCIVALVLNRRSISLPLAAPVAAGAAFVIVLLIGTPPVLLAGGLTILALSSAVLVLSVATTGGWVLVWPPLRWVGSISYGLYLWHPFLFNAFPNLPHLVLVIPAVLAAVASARWIEQPIIRWAKGGTLQRVPG